ncbi:uncharacterized protein LOC132754023 [Ruditapes philippinarum]|uniref:uncharacterized protein LOC132754023 n=1 Tax=Ruditapes philippinarum TaxID=129788 RepID=UPI00295B5D51|nr:uncharacterized protein LOC132754023 [Ruditapes philippinarum]
METAYTSPNNSSESVVAKYKFEYEGLIYNKARTKFSVLTRKELDSCQNNFLKYCQISAPIYQRSVSKMCVSALFLQDDNDIRNNCKIMVDTNARLPKAINILDGRWIISSDKDLKFVILCDNIQTNRQEVIAKAPVSIISLNQNCKAFNNYLILTPWFNKNSTVHSLNGDMHSNTLFWSNTSKNHLFQTLNESLHHFSSIKIPTDLKPISHIPLEALVSKLHYLQTISLDSDKPFPLWGIILIISGVIFSIIVILISVFFIRKRLSKKYVSVKCHGPELIMNAKGRDKSLYKLVSKMSEMDDNSSEKMEQLQGSILSSLYPKL